MNTTYYAGLARNSDPDTAKEAAANTNAARMAALVLADLRKNGPSTSREIAARLNVGRDSVSPRIPQLRLDGCVHETNERRDGQAVWAASGVSVEA